MTPAEKCDFEFKHLNLVLSFFPRVDSRLSLVLGVDLGMLALLASNAPGIHAITMAEASFAVIPLLLIGWSVVEVYRGLFPSLDGGDQSLIYFSTVGGRTESRFIEELQATLPEALAKDLMGQVWRNSQILRMKFDRLKMAFVLMAVTIPLWIAAMAAFITQNSSSTRLLTR